jgi:hypothetical protein
MHTCAACGCPLDDSYYVLFGSDDRFCETCIETRPRCDSCGAPLGAHFWRLHDGRLQCGKCHNTAIYDPALAQQLYAETVGGIASKPGLVLNVGADFRMVDEPTLRDLRSGSTIHPNQPGHAPDHTFTTSTRTLGLYVRKGHRRTIYMLYGVPRLIFRTTVAHEYAHAWQTEHCPLLRDIHLIEGFAEWVSYQHLCWFGASRAAQRMLAAPHPYRPDLERMLALEQQLGPQGLIEYMKRAE